MVPVNINMNSRTGRQLQRYNDGRRQVVGCIPYRYNQHNDQLELLLISSQKGEQMLFPKGGWETDESIKEAAARETFEEAGIRGLVEYDLGSYMFRSKRYGTFYEGFMFSMFVKEESDTWPEKHVRTRQWMTVKEATDICQHGWMKEAVHNLVLRLQSSQRSHQDMTYCRIS